MTGEGNSPLLPVLLEAGGRTGEYHDRTVVRHFGDPEAEYEAATTRAAVIDRSHRTRLLVHGRAPSQMLNGILTGRLPDAPDGGEDVWTGAGTYHAVLTPKGKMVTDLWAFSFGETDRELLLLDVPVAGREGLLGHLGRFLPPRFATVTDRSGESAAITVVGPDAAAVVGRLVLGLRVEPSVMDVADEGEWWATSAPVSASEPALAGLIATRTRDVWPDAWTVYGPTAAVRTLWSRLVDDGVLPAGLGVWSTLRIEHGRPAYGSDMDEATLPPEAGIVERAVDHSKGCYTGQEVIVRIRDRGHVNRHLRLLELGEGPAPAPGTELLANDDSGKVVGVLTSIAESPKLGGVIALGYVRRGVSEVRVAGRVVTVPGD